MRRIPFVSLLVLLLVATAAQAQNRLPNMPGFDRYQEVSRSQGALRLGLGTVAGLNWSEDGNQLFFTRPTEERDVNRHFRVDLRRLTVTEIPASEAPPQPARRPPGRRAARATQFEDYPSPDGTWTAYYREFNVVLVNNQTQEEVPVTVSGVRELRYGTGCWVYGEELSQNDAMWWSPDGSKLAFYEMDERGCKVFYLAEDLTETYPILNTERYPKPGERDPVAGLFIYDLASKKQIRVDVGGDPTQYVYDISWSPDGTELLYHRTNRHQNVMEVRAADPATGASRLVVREEQPTWQENSPTMRFLADGKRFIWGTERNGYQHYELRHLDGRLLNPITQVADYPCVRLGEVDEATGLVYYLANSSEVPINAQVHRVRLDGRQATRLTTREMNYSLAGVSPDHKWLVVTYQTVEDAPTTVLLDERGRERLVLVESDLSVMEQLGMPMPELFTFKAEDGSDLFGRLYKPGGFDPSKQYPLVISIYAGPSSRAVSNNFSPLNALTEFGFLVAQIDARGTSGRGKAFEGAGYMKLGIIEIKDQADGVRFLAQRPYVDGGRVGIYGHSYGGYMSALALVKFPDVYHVGVAGAPVTDWKNYDTIYTERYMRTPQENPEGYRDGSCLTWAAQMKGRLLIVHGLIDDNVHPQNTWMLVEKFHENDIPFDIQVFPTSRHGIRYSAYYNNLRMEYLIDYLKPVAARR